MRLIIIGTLLLLSVFTTLAINKRDEVLDTQTGVIQRCENLGGNKQPPLFHATIKAADGSYLIASLKSCTPDSQVTIHVRRGALYFNTVFSAGPR